MLLPTLLDTEEKTTYNTDVEVIFLLSLLRDGRAAKLIYHLLFNYIFYLNVRKSKDSNLSMHRILYASVPNLVPQIYIPLVTVISVTK